MSSDNTLAAFIADRDAQLGRIARTLHNDVGQILSAVGLQLEGLRLDYRDRIPEITEGVTEIQNNLEEAMATLRRLSQEVNPSIVERTGFRYAVEGLVDRQRRDFKGGEIRLTLDPELRLLGKPAAAFFRVVECAVKLATSAGEASDIDVRIAPADKWIELELSFSETLGTDPNSHIERLLLEYYGYHAGATVQVQSSPQQGTIIRSSLPYGA